MVINILKEYYFAEPWTSQIEKQIKPDSCNTPSSAENLIVPCQSKVHVLFVSYFYINCKIKRCILYTFHLQYSCHGHYG